MTKLVCLLSLSGLFAWQLAGLVLLRNLLNVRLGEPELPDLALFIARTVFHEVKPLYWYLLACHTITQAVVALSIFGGVVEIVVAVGAWFLFKDVDKDDRWKRRKKKLKEMVTALEGRLHVVPAN